MERTGEKGQFSVGSSNQQSMTVVGVVDYNQCTYV